MSQQTSGNPVSGFDLGDRIRSKRAEVRAYLQASLPRRRRLLNISLSCGSLAALLTAAPALGGKSFSEWLGETAGLGGPAWQWLCALAALLSVVAAGANQWLKSQGSEEKLAKAQLCAVRLEMLDIGLAAGNLDTERATAEFLQCLESVAFLQGE